MDERRYECVMDFKEQRITVNVFTKEITSSDELRPLALKCGIEFLKEMGEEAIISEITLIGYKDCSSWPLF